MTTVSDIADKYKKDTADVKKALESIGYGEVKIFTAVDPETEGKLDAYWKQKSSSAAKNIASPQETVPRDRKIGNTQVMEVKRRSFSKPTRQPPPVPPPAQPLVVEVTALPVVTKSSESPAALDMEGLLRKQKSQSEAEAVKAKLAAEEASQPQPPKKKPVQKAAVPVAAKEEVAQPASVTDNNDVEEAQVPGAAEKKRKVLQDVIKIDENILQKRKKRRQQRAVAASAQERVLQNQHTFQKPISQIVREVSIPQAIPVYRLADRVALKSSVIIRKLMEHGITVTANEILDKETAWIIVEDLGHHPVIEKEDDIEHEILQDNAALEEQPRPPIITIMGHVDHGKTSLLDYLRKTKVADGEAGGITQHIGAYQVDTPTGKVTFIDTPGHALFSQMRARGANVTDIVVIVVAADDGVKPQTVESINHAQAAGATIIVAINKMDKPGVDLDRIKTELSENGLLPEDWGGDVMIVPLSAKTGDGVPQLLEAISTQADILEFKAPQQTSARGVVIEARVDKGCGIVASVIITRGTLERGDIFLCGSERGRVRVISNCSGKAIEKALPSTPIEVQGLAGMPEVGAEIVVLNDERKVKDITQTRQNNMRLSRLAKNTPSLVAADLWEEKPQKKEVNLIVKADVGGSCGALATAINTNGKNIITKIVHKAVGGVTESDIHLAHASNATIIAFNVRPDSKARKLAEVRGVKIIFGKVIYDLVESVREILLASLPPEQEEHVIGTAEVRKVYGISKTGNIAGCFISEGMAIAESQVRVLRDSVVIYEGVISSLRHYKENVKEVRMGEECGIGVRRFNDIKVGDVIEVLEILQKEAEI